MSIKLYSEKFTQINLLQGKAKGLLKTTTVVYAFFIKVPYKTAISAKQPLLSSGP